MGGFIQSIAVIYRALLCDIQSIAVIYRAMLCDIQSNAVIYRALLWYTEHCCVIYRALLCDIQSIAVWYTEHCYVIHRALLCDIQSIAVIYRSLLCDIQSIAVWYTEHCCVIYRALLWYTEHCCDTQSIAVWYTEHYWVISEHYSDIAATMHIPLPVSVCSVFYELRPGRKVPGSTEAVGASTVAACAEVCTLDPNCVGYDFNRGQSSCWPTILDDSGETDQNPGEVVDHYTRFWNCSGQ